MKLVQSRGGRFSKQPVASGLSAYRFWLNQTVQAEKETRLATLKRDEKSAELLDRRDDKVLQNRAEIQKIENQKQNLAITNTKKARDSEVKSLQREAEEARRQADFLRDFAPKAAKEMYDVADKAIEHITDVRGRRAWQKADANGDIDKIYSAQKFVETLRAQKDSNGMVGILLEAIKKGDDEAADWIIDKYGNSNKVFQTIGISDLKTRLPSLFAQLEGIIDELNLRRTPDNIKAVYELRGFELATKLGINPYSTEGIEVIQLFQEQASALGEVAYNVDSKNKNDLRTEKSIKSAGENTTYTSVSMAVLTRNQGARTKNLSGQVISSETLYESGVYVIKELVKLDKYQTGDETGWRLFQKQVLTQPVPHEKGEKYKGWMERHASLLEVARKAWEEARDAALDKETAAKETKDKLLRASIENRVTNPQSKDKDTNESNYLDLSNFGENGGYQKLKSIYEQAVKDGHTETADYINNELLPDYDMDNPKFNLNQYLDLVKAGAEGDPAGFLNALYFIPESERGKFENQYEHIALFHSMGLDLDKLQATAEEDIYFAVGLEPNPYGSRTPHSSTVKKVTEYRNHLSYLLTANAEDIKKKHNGNAVAYKNDILIQARTELIKNEGRWKREAPSDREPGVGEEKTVFVDTYYASRPGDPRKIVAPSFEDMKRKIIPAHTGEKELNFQQFIGEGDKAGNDVLNTVDTNRLLTGIESGEDVIHLSGEIHKLADFFSTPEKPLSARTVVNYILQQRGLPHRLPPDNLTLLRWDGYTGKNPKTSGDVEGIRIIQSIQNQTGKTVKTNALDEDWNRIVAEGFYPEPPSLPPTPGESLPPATLPGEPATLPVHPIDLPGI